MLVKQGNKTIDIEPLAHRCVRCNEPFSDKETTERYKDIFDGKKVNPLCSECYKETNQQ